jgi:PqqD family protein of HPr-rel-A system
LNPLTALHWRRWGDDWVVFDAGSGQTHQMDMLTAVTLMCIEAGPTDLIGLVEQVAGEFDLPLAEIKLDVLTDLVKKFNALGLIEPIAP